MCGAHLLSPAGSEPLRKSRSLADFKLGDWALPGSADGASCDSEQRSLRRRICSLEDLAGLNSRRASMDAAPSLRDLFHSLTEADSPSGLPERSAEPSSEPPPADRRHALEAAARHEGEGSCESITTRLLAPGVDPGSVAVPGAAAPGPLDPGPPSWRSAVPLRTVREPVLGALGSPPQAGRDSPPLFGGAGAPALFTESAVPLEPARRRSADGSPGGSADGSAHGSADGSAHGSADGSADGSAGGSRGGSVRAGAKPPADGSLLAGLAPYSGSGGGSPSGPSPTHSFGSLPSSASGADLAAAAPPPPPAEAPHLSEGFAAEELFYRLNHARQTVDFVKLKAAAYSPLNRLEASVWGALDLLSQQREYEAGLAGSRAEGLDPGMPLVEHALQTAEACRLAWPGVEWAPLAGLLHGLGKLLAKLGPEPQWAVCGESFPVGCRFSGAIVHPHMFSANPDRRRRLYSTPTGMYAPGCGLSAVLMSWGAPEYLYLVLAMNATRLPPEALFLLRHQKFYALTRPGGAYAELLSPGDRALLPMLRTFQGLCRYRRMELPGRLPPGEQRALLGSLLAKYVPQGVLRW